MKYPKVLKMTVRAGRAAQWKNACSLNTTLSTTTTRAEEVIGSVSKVNGIGNIHMVEVVSESNVYHWRFVEYRLHTKEFSASPLHSFTSQAQVQKLHNFQGDS